MLHWRVPCFIIIMNTFPFLLYNNGNIFLYNHSIKCCKCIIVQNNVCLWERNGWIFFGGLSVIRTTFNCNYFNARLQTIFLIIITSIPSLAESRSAAKTVTNWVVIRRGRKAFTSATFPKRPIMFLKSSSLSGNI